MLSEENQFPITYCVILFTYVTFSRSVYNVLLVGGRGGECGYKGATQDLCGHRTLLGVILNLGFIRRYHRRKLGKGGVGAP